MDKKSDRGVAVHCTVCGMRKKPIGRSAPLEMANSLCDHECDGYYADPHPGHMWPGETDTLIYNEMTEPEILTQVATMQAHVDTLRDACAGQAEQLIRMSDRCERLEQLIEDMFRWMDEVDASRKALAGELLRMSGMGGLST